MGRKKGTLPRAPLLRPRNPLGGDGENTLKKRETTEGLKHNITVERGGDEEMSKEKREQCLQTRGTVRAHCQTWHARVVQVKNEDFYQEGEKKRR